MMACLQLCVLFNFQICGSLPPVFINIFSSSKLTLCKCVLSAFIKRSWRIRNWMDHSIPFRVKWKLTPTARYMQRGIYARKPSSKPCPSSSSSKLINSTVTGLSRWRTWRRKMYRTFLCHVRHCQNTRGTQLCSLLLSFSLHDLSFFVTPSASYFSCFRSTNNFFRP